MIALRFIRLNNENIVIGERDGISILEGEVQSDTGELGQIMQSDGTFITPEPDTTPVQATIEEQILAETIYQTTLLEMNMIGAM